ncbi:MAG: class I tRNA ligase family protein [Alphaproteobacteria bacterium]
MAALQLYNTLSRKKDIFMPLDPAHVRLYACGPTVYNYAHIGNARMAVVFDLLVRLLDAVTEVTYVSNITDVDDKIIAAARESGASIDEITKKYARIYNEDMKALGVAAPDIQPLATTHITHMIALIEALIEKGTLMRRTGACAVPCALFSAYGGLSGT